MEIPKKSSKFVPEFFFFEKGASFSKKSHPKKIKDALFTPRLPRSSAQQRTAHSSAQHMLTVLRMQSTFIDTSLIRQ
jgi:hypothetical protein